MALKKRPYKKATVVKNLGKDFGLDADIDVEFWKDPSRQVVFSLLEILSSRALYDVLPDEEVAGLDKKYWNSVSQIFVDCSVEGISFKTPQECEKSFDDPTLPWGIFHQATIMYISWLTENNANLKNVLRRLSEASTSGSDNEEETNEQKKT